MRIEIHASETLPSADDKAYIERRLDQALAEYRDQVAGAQVWLVGILRTDYAEAQYCMINVRLRDGSLVACDGTDLELRTALDCALQHINHEMSRSLERLHHSRPDTVDSELAWQVDTTLRERPVSAA